MRKNSAVLPGWLFEPLAYFRPNQFRHGGSQGTCVESGCDHFDTTDSSPDTQGVSSEQDMRFKDKEALAIKKGTYPPSFDTKVNTRPSSQ